MPTLVLIFKKKNCMAKCIMKWILKWSEKAKLLSALRVECTF